VIQVQTMPGDVHPLTMGSADQVQVGDLVTAIGSPFGLGSTMTTGIISALGRDIPALVTNYTISQAIQTDATINPGNSGGPLLNLNGYVIGVNSQIATGGTNQSSGVGFAIPVHIVKMVVPSLIHNHSYSWPYLGLYGATVDLMIQRANQLGNQQGAYIDQVSPGSPAEHAGLQGSTGTSDVLATQVPTGGDVIDSLDGQTITSYDQFLSLTSQYKPGDTITVTVFRDGQKKSLRVKLGARPSNATNTSSFLGGSSSLR
jgi:serine protease Do